MVGRGEITDAAWERVAPLLPEDGRPGGRWRDHRVVVNGILWKLRTGAPWRDLPSRYGPWQTCYDRFVRWRRDGTWEKLLSDAQTKSDAVGGGGVAGERGLHRGPGIPARRGRPSQAEPGGQKKGVEHPPDEALGRTRGGLSTKVHLACDGKGRPLVVVLTPGQRSDSTQLSVVLDAIRVPRTGRGRPRKRPAHLLADKSYGKGVYRRMLRARGIPHTIPERSDHRERRAGRPGRPLGLDAATYAKRNVVERFVNRLKQWRGIATRYEKRAPPTTGQH